ncbi:hypothetical protein [Marininema halotolerans]|uniref:DNA helicase HerA, contains HAS-barrel and ATPase domains n=1 Tax=Marininema halotolerans TaxID=1155944 RepID=A0A1I6URH5_9BACL|nr:hypothetical protein [Marininema halotolerans]SFT03934.1 DNA helicase HerA, contains HAS-barrel and ATPase domains [Marininema halotolerans]
MVRVGIRGRCGGSATEAEGLGTFAAASGLDTYKSICIRPNRHDQPYGDGSSESESSISLRATDRSHPGSQLPLSFGLPVNRVSSNNIGSPPKRAGVNQVGGNRVSGHATCAGDHEHSPGSGRHDQHRNLPAREVILQIIPDRSVDNQKSEELARAIAGMYQTPWERRDGWRIKPNPSISWEVILSKKDGACFFIRVPVAWQAVIEKQLATIWPRATITDAEDPLAQMQPTLVNRLELGQHYLFSFKVDRRNNGPLPSILDTLSIIGDKSSAALQFIMEPAPPDWYSGAEGAYQKFCQGRMPQKFGLSGKAVRRSAVKVAADIAVGATDIIAELLSGEESPKDGDDASRVEALREKPGMRAAVAEKLKGDAVRVTCRIAVEGSQTEAEAITRSLWYGLRSMDGDQTWAMRQEKDFEAMLARKSGYSITPDYLSLREAGALLQLPTGPLQEEHGLVSVRHRETSIHPDIKRKDGIYIGDATDHGESIPIHFPTVDLNDTCLPRAFVAGMGAGKTTTVTNLAKRVATKGWTAVAIDPGKGEVGDRLMKELGPDRVTRITFGEKPISLDIREAFHSPAGRNRLAVELLSFFDDDSVNPLGAQTARYLRAAAKAAPNGRLVELHQVLEDEKYRATLYEEMGERESALWSNFDKATAARRAQLIEPIFNRLDTFLGDDYLERCMDSTDGIDMVELLKPGKVIVFDLPERLLGKMGVNVIGGILTAKLNVAMHVRNTDHPVWVLADEPHQYMKSARVWETAVVESRKFRFCYCWFMHDLPQMGRGLVRRISAAGAHWVIGKTSKANLKELAEEISPFTVEEALELWRSKEHKHKAIGLIQPYGKPVVFQMAKK